MNAPPSYLAANPGNRRKLPSPTALPVTARMTPNLLPQRSFGFGAFIVSLSPSCVPILRPRVPFPAADSLSSPEIAQTMRRRGPPRQAASSNATLPAFVDCRLTPPACSPLLSAAGPCPAPLYEKGYYHPVLQCGKNPPERDRPGAEGIL